MASSISKEILKKEIHEILKDGNLQELSAKKVRLQLQEKLVCDLLSRKDEIGAIVMDFINSKAESEGNDSEEDEVEEVKAPTKRKAAPSAKPAKKKKKTESGSDNDEDKVSDQEYSPRKTRGSRAGGRKKNSADGDQPKKASSKGKGRATGFTRAYKLSPELASFMGAEEMPRHEVVKKMWAVIKERNLLDPKNKQFAICDEEIHKIMGVKRFRTFGMLKYLKSHFFE